MLSPKKNSKDYRFYSDGDLSIAIKIKSFQKLGFSLKEIKTILSINLENLEKNLEKLFITKEAEARKIEDQLRRIKLVEKSIKNNNQDFSIIEQLTEINADDRAQIMLGYEDLADRAVREKLPKVEIVNEDFFKLIKKGEETYEHDPADLYKFAEYFKVAPNILLRSF